MLLEKERIFFIVPSIFHVFKRWKQKPIDSMKIFPGRGSHASLMSSKNKVGTFRNFNKKKGVCRGFGERSRDPVLIKFFYRDFDYKMHRFWYLLHKIELCFRKSYNSCFLLIRKGNTLKIKNTRTIYLDTSCSRKTISETTCDSIENVICGYHITSHLQKLEVIRSNRLNNNKV